MDHQALTSRNQFITGHHKPTQSRRGSKFDYHWPGTNFWPWPINSIYFASCSVASRNWTQSSRAHHWQQSSNPSGKCSCWFTRLNPMGTDCQCMQKGKRVGCSAISQLILIQDDRITLTSSQSSGWYWFRCLGRWTDTSWTTGWFCSHSAKPTGSQFGHCDHQFTLCIQHLQCLVLSPVHPRTLFQNTLHLFWLPVF